MYGHYDLMIEMEKRGVTWSIEDGIHGGLYNIISESGNIECLKHAIKKKVSYEIADLEKDDVIDDDDRFKFIIEKILKTNDKLEGTPQYECLQYAIENNHVDVPVGSPVFDIMVGTAGNIKFLDYLVDKHYKDNIRYSIYIATSAIQNKNLKFLRYLKNKYYVQMFSYHSEYGCKNCTREAANIGDLEIMKWTYEKGGKCTYDVIREAAENGHIECLKFAIRKYKKDKIRNRYEYGDIDRDRDLIDLYYTAACKGYIECIKILYAEGFPMKRDLYEGAAQNNQLECLKYLHEYVNSFPSYWNPKNGKACEIAEENGHFECFKWLFDNGFQWKGISKKDKIKEGHRKCLEYILNECG